MAPFLALLTFLVSSVLGYNPNNFTLHYSNISQQKIVDIKTYPHSDALIPIETSYSGGNVVGYRPSLINENGYPLYVYTTGTSMSYTAQSAVSYCQYMAANGFVAVSADYSNAVYPLSCGQFSGKAEQLWDQNRANSLLNNICNNPSLNVNCQRGIVTSGMSQGAQLASMAAQYNGNQISGMYLMGGGDRLFVGGIPTFNFGSCLSFPALNIAANRIRSMVGENDGYFGVNMAGVRIQQNSISGTVCEGDATDCIQGTVSSGGGFGWYIVQGFQTASGTAPHCYAYRGASCSSGLWDDHYETDPDGLRRWSQEQNLQWLIARV